MRRYFLLVCPLLLFAVQQAASSELPNADTGPYEVRIVDDVVLADPVHPRDVRFRVMVPRGTGEYPVVVHSHGGFCTTNYDLITAHWASHGYIVVAPYHPDSPQSGDKPDMRIIVQRRLRDLTFTVDALDTILEQADFAGTADTDSIGISGHSFGAGMALMKNGMYLLDMQKSDWSTGFDERFIAGIYFSAPGPNDEMPPNGFEGVRRPFLATGGTNDEARMDPPGGMSLADFRREAYEKAPPGDKYSLIIDAADHYLGGLVCNPERGGEPDPDAVRILNAVTTTFLDAYLRGSGEALAVLRDADMAVATDGRADFRRR